MGRGGTDETSDGPQQVRSKRIKARCKSTNSKKQANGKERGRRAVSISSSSEPAGLEESASDMRVIGCLEEKSNTRKRPHPSGEGDAAEPKPK